MFACPGLEEEQAQGWVRIPGTHMVGGVGMQFDEQAEAGVWRGHGRLWIAERANEKMNAVIWEDCDSR